LTAPRSPTGRAAFHLRPLHERKSSTKLLAYETTAPVLDPVAVGPGRGVHRRLTGQRIVARGKPSLIKSRLILPGDAGAVLLTTCNRIAGRRRNPGRSLAAPLLASKQPDRLEASNRQQGAWSRSVLCARLLPSWLWRVLCLIREPRTGSLPGGATQLELSFPFVAQGENGLQLLLEDGDRALYRGWREHGEGGRTSCWLSCPRRQRPLHRINARN
jgi:hypothetical protein